MDKSPGKAVPTTCMKAICILKFFPKWSVNLVLFILHIHFISYFMRGYKCFALFLQVMEQTVNWIYSVCHFTNLCNLIASERLTITSFHGITMFVNSISLSDKNGVNLNISRFTINLRCTWTARVNCPICSSIIVRHTWICNLWAPVILTKDLIRLDSPVEILSQRAKALK